MIIISVHSGFTAIKLTLLMQNNTGFKQQNLEVFISTQSLLTFYFQRMLLGKQLSRNFYSPS